MQFRPAVCCGGEVSKRKSYLVPRVGVPVLCMGWSWAPWFAQELLQEMLIKGVPEFEPDGAMRHKHPPADAARARARFCFCGLLYVRINMHIFFVFVYPLAW